MPHDLVIRNGTLIDGTGAPAFPADVAIDDERITEVRQGVGKGRREIDASGRGMPRDCLDLNTPVPQLRGGA